MGANRVAFGTLAMVSLGCTICRGCQLDTCHVGIATQIETVEQAQEHGLKKFTPPGADAAESCARFFQAMGEEVKAVVGSLGYDRAQDLVGRYDLLEQISHEEKIDLAPLITPLEEFLDLEPIDLPVEEEALVEARAEAGLVRAKPLRMEPKQASHEIAQVADKVFDGSCVSRRVPARGPTRTTASSAPSSPGRSPAPGSTTARPRAPRTTTSLSWSSTEGASRARASVRSTSGASPAAWRAGHRTASVRRCWAAPSRS